VFDKALHDILDGSAERNTKGDGPGETLVEMFGPLLNPGTNIEIL